MVFVHEPKYYIFRDNPLNTPGFLYNMGPGSMTYTLFISVTKHKKLNQKTNPCMEDPEYDFHRCVINSLTRLAGCRSPWDMLSSQEFPICDDLEKIQILEKMFQSNSEGYLEQVVDNTKCMPPCLFNEYKLGLEPDKWDSKAISKNKIFKLKFTDNKTIIEKEIESYSFVSLVSDIGGALGLFLGFSFVMVWDEAEALIRKMRTYWKDNLITK